MAFFSGQSKEKIIKIMHDSRVGAFGVIGLFLLLLLKYHGLLLFTGINRIVVLLLMPAISRWFIIFVAWKFPVNADSKLAKSFMSSLDYRQFLLATVWILLIISILALLFIFFYFGRVS